MLKNRTKILLLLTIVLIMFLPACQQSSNKPSLKDMGNRLKFTDGTLISQDSSDDYNPILLKNADSTLLLLFGSNRSGTHKIYITRSASVYSNDYKLPSFNVPVTLNTASVDYSSANRIYFAAELSGTDIKIYLTNDSNNIRTMVVPLANLATGATSSVADLMGPGSVVRKGKVRGFNRSNSFLLYEKNANTVFSAEVANTSDAGTQICGLTFHCNGLVYVPSSISSNGFIFSGSNGRFYTYESAVRGSLKLFNEELGRQSISAGSVSMLDNGATDLFFFSAGSGSTANQNLYVATESMASHWTSVDANMPPAVEFGITPWYTFSGVTNGPAPNEVVSATSDGGFITGFSRYDIPTLSGLSPVTAYQGGGAHSLVILKYLENGSLQWFTRVGGVNCNLSSGGAITQSSDGGYFVVGTCYSGSPLPPSAGLVALSAPVGFYIVKLNSSGAQVWGTYVNGDYANSVIPTSDNGALVCARSNGTNNVTTLDTISPKNPPIASQPQGHVVRYGSDGHVIWHTYFSGTADSNLQACSSASGNNYLLAGSVTTAPVYATDSFYTQTQTPAVPAPLIAHGGSGTYNNGWLIKMNDSGEIVWHTFSGSAANTDFSGVVELTDGSIVAGSAANSATVGNYGLTPIYAFQTGASNNMFMVKFSSTGTPIWLTFAGAAANYGSGFKLDKTSTGFAVATAYHISNFSISGMAPLRAHTGVDQDFWLGNYNSNGGIIWHSFLGGTGNQVLGVGRSLAVSSNGSFAIGGVANNLSFSLSPVTPIVAAGIATDALLIRVPKNGVFQ